MTYTAAWKATPAARKEPPRWPKHMSPVLTARDSPVPSEGPCDGFEAGLLLGIYGPAAVDVICERVAKCGGRHDLSH